MLEVLRYHSGKIYRIQSNLDLADKCGPVAVCYSKMLLFSTL